MKLKTDEIIRFGAVLILLAGICWTVINGLRVHSYAGRIQAKLAVLKQLQEFKHQQDIIEASFGVFMAASNTVPSLTALASGSVTGSVPDIRDLDVRLLGRGLAVKRVEVVFNEVSLNSVANFLRSAETQSPPWRLAECKITASQKADGFGAATLTMETITRQTADAGKLNSAH